MEKKEGGVFSIQDDTRAFVIYRSVFSAYDPQERALDSHDCR